MQRKIAAETQLSLVNDTSADPNVVGFESKFENGVGFES